MTTAGFSTTDYHVWPMLAVTTLILVMFMGAMAGSTAGGMKVSRIIIAIKGAYILAKESKSQPDAILIATGSEVELALKAKEQLLTEGIDVRVVSMPSMELFEQQTEEYKQSVLPNNVRKRVLVEAGTEFGWGKYIGIDGKSVTINEFGSSAPAKVLFEKYGFTVENVVKTVKEVCKNAN